MKTNNEGERMSWKKETPLTDPVSTGCICCGAKAIKAPLETMLAVGFGGCGVTKDGECVWSGDDPEKTLAEFEVMAKADPDHDWRMFKNAPLYDAVWQRQSEGHWLLIEKGQGFA
jgi:hypothetical protein